MSRVLLNEGRPVLVEAAGARIGRGPWARLLATAVVPDESSTRAERGRALARTGHVHTVTVDRGEIAARVLGSGDREYDVTLSTQPLPPRVWAAVVGSARELAAAAQGLEQSVRLEHELAAGWGEPLVPPGRAVRRSCTCPDADFSGTCKHVVALTYVVADAIDRDPSLLLHWRGCGPTGAASPRDTVASAPTTLAMGGDSWQAGALPQLHPPRALPPGAVLKRLGRSGLRIDGDELADVLQRAYAAFADSS